MNIQKVILETLGMMGFTFLVGFGVAYVIKILVESFHFFRKENFSVMVQDYRKKIAYERKRQANMRRVLTMMDKDSDVELLKYLYENKKKIDAEEAADGIYDLFKFYKGIYKDKKESEGIDDLIKYYNGEV